MQQLEKNASGREIAMTATTAAKSRFRTASKAALTCALAASLAISQGSYAALTDLSPSPLASGSATPIPPNILFTLDDSGSMTWTHMPDNVISDLSHVGYKNWLCNTVYYNPNLVYVPPSQADGTDFPSSTFTAAKPNGYDASTTGANTPVDLSTAFQAYTAATLTFSGSSSNDTPQKAYYYQYTGTATLVPTQAQCTNSSSSSFPHTFTSTSTGGGTWTKVQIPPAQEQNFANWYTYYRTRIMMMKGAASRAFVNLGPEYRVGFITINPGNPVSSTKYLAISEFAPTQKSAWFTKLFSIVPANSTPLREALSRAGRHYAGKQDGINSGMTGDPIQYSCQQNFTILTTDGYWNAGSATGKKIDGTTSVGEQDGDLSITPRPMYDGQTATTTTTDKWNEYRSVSCTVSRGSQGCTARSGCAGSQIQVRPWTISTQQKTSGGIGVGTTTTTGSAGSYSSPNWLDSSCQISAVPFPPSTAPVPPQITQTSGNVYRHVDPTYPTGGFNGRFEQPAPTSPCTTWPCTATSTPSGGSTDSLADVAQYYYWTDLRGPGSLGAAVGTPPVQHDVGTDNNVPAIGTGPEDDKAPWQHMTTFTMGLGLAGTLNYRSDYKTATTGDFAAIRSGTKDWPAPVGDTPTALDDLWHAGVNGRGQFFSAADPDSVVSSLNTALAGIKTRTASAAAAATSNLEPVAGDNFAYTAKYKTVEWNGELEAHEIDLATGAVLPTVVWSAQSKLDTLTAAACDSRTIKLFRSGATGNLVDFKWNTDTCDAVTGLPVGSPQTTLNATEQANFGATQVTALSQYGDMTPVPDQITPAAGSNLVNFLRGQRGKENFQAGDVNKLYRLRTHVLGDIVNAQPVFVKTAIGDYADTGYATFKAQVATRTPMVYVAANDGMLHAFYAGTSVSDPQGGLEAWAFIPTMVLPDLHHLASVDYTGHHRFYTDGTPAAGDVYDPNTTTWKTIIVGGLNAGGRGYYALDITDPASPKGLWEFKYSETCFDPSNSTTWFADCNLGYTFGNPLIGKLADGRWVVFVTSGYNNLGLASAHTGDGKGFLYVLEALTGKILFKIGTGAGDTTTPSGLNKIAGWADDAIVNNTAVRIYGVDILGNIWRFDVNDNLGPAGLEAQLVATAKDAFGVPQPITTKPELGESGSPASPFIFVSTGRYLGVSDLPAPPAASQVNSVYAIKDPLNTTTIPDLRTALKKNQITTTTINGTLIRQSACVNNCSSTDGWFVDLPEDGERVNVDMKLQLGTLVVPSNVPSSNASCTIGGHSWINFFDYSSGLAVSNSENGSVGTKLSDSLVVGINVVRLPSGKTVVIVTTSDAKQQTPPTAFGTGKPQGKRVSWRELVQ
jgi:type IV pilus assembly protein PilY1